MDAVGGKAYAIGGMDSWCITGRYVFYGDAPTAAAALWVCCGCGVWACLAFGGYGIDGALRFSPMKGEPLEMAATFDPKTGL